ncbi:hypothetical protein [Microbispora triticiradicis]|uniref:hypothetical protein n=1 Tax=Microbispora triticiradicis TaxID=2200763 RepID=UPI0010589FBD|nr:hypothetical protein [Microbispora triticiradicis]
MLRRLVVLCAAVTTLSACSGGTTTSAAGEPGAAPSSAAAPAQVLKLGEPATIRGEGGQPLTVTPTGVYFYRGRTGDALRPAERWWAAVSIRVEATKAADRLPPGATGEWQVRQGSRTFTTVGGNAGNAPWVGRVGEGVEQVAPGDPQVAVKTFDIPKGGGELRWVTQGEPPVRWSMPGRTTGSGLDDVKAVMRVG